jgi:hypothetical protein
MFMSSDASGGVSVEAHDMGIRRLVAAGAQPITWLAMAGELQRDWARIQYLGDLGKIFAERAGATGSAIAWTMQGRFDTCGSEVRPHYFRYYPRGHYQPCTINHSPSVELQP